MPIAPNPKFTADTLERLLREVPNKSDFKSRSPRTTEWLGEVGATLKSWSVSSHMQFQYARNQLASRHPGLVGAAYDDLLVVVNEAFFNARQSISESSREVSVDSGKPYQYFKHISSILNNAKERVLFVDPYLRPEILDRYFLLPPPEVRIDFFTSNYARALASATELLITEHPRNVEVRRGTNMHDRFLIIDDSKCFSSTGSFSDGAKKSSVVISELRDIAALVVDKIRLDWEAAPVLYSNSKA
jgi:hypothetical protein